MDYLGLIGFCVGFGWMPVMLIFTPIYVVVEKIRNKRRKYGDSKEKHFE